MRKMLLVTASLLMAAISSQLVRADAAADIAYRQGVMAVVGGHMKSMGTILKGKVRTEDLAFHADAMRDVSLIAPSLFPAGSGEGKTETLPAVWSEPAEFKLAMDQYTTAAANMAEAAATGDMSKIGPAMQGLGKSCKGCHDDFREKN